MSNLPKLRFSEFGGEWEENKLEKYCNKIASGKSKQNDNGEYYLYGSTGIIGRTDEYSNDGKFILIARVGANAGLTNVVEGRFGVTDNTLVLNLKDSVDIDFILSLLHKYNLNRLIFGSGQPLITGGQLKSLKLNLPSKNEQEKIASFLTSVDTKIEQLIRKEELLGQYKKGVMQKIFNQEIRFKADDGSEFPEWEEKKLGDVGDFKSGIGFPETEQGGDFGVPFFKVSDMNLVDNTFYMKSANHYVTDKQISKLKFKVIKEASIIFAKVGAAIFLERKRIAVNFLIDNNMMAFIPKANLLFMKYIFDTIKLSKYVQVGALPSYNASDLKIIKVKIPFSIDEQTKIANFLSSIDKKIEVISQTIEKAKEFKKGLLQQMFV